ncbi:unnamed protein product [Brachionus calyciflorus]|uniref:Uncharacterized protein n=1 Tax=Brachionus calyciflorus TaxID=104777 RepID=A0A814IID4_9BILA|nr:unnamed protein product [Brachionus calyciflorus]
MKLTVFLILAICLVQLTISAPANRGKDKVKKAQPMPKRAKVKSGATKLSYEVSSDDYVPAKPYRPAPVPYMKEEKKEDRSYKVPSYPQPSYPKETYVKESYPVPEKPVYARPEPPKEEYAPRYDVPSYGVNKYEPPKMEYNEPRYEMNMYGHENRETYRIPYDNDDDDDDDDHYGNEPSSYGHDGYGHETVWVQNTNDNWNENDDVTSSENEQKNKNLNLNDLIELIKELQEQKAYKTY